MKGRGEEKRENDVERDTKCERKTDKGEGRYRL
jgi:hypothetical protein